MLSAHLKDEKARVYAGKLNVEVDENLITVNEELRVQIAPDGRGYTLDYPDSYGSFALRPKSEPKTMQYKKTVGVEYDPVYYQNGMNGLTVEESTERAFNKIWYDLHGEGKNNPKDLKDAIRHMIRNGEGRQAVYALAGGIERDYKDGLYYGVPFSYIFAGFVNGKIDREV